MARDFLLPDIGEGLTEAEIVRWLVAEGETVQVDQPIVEIETDKSLMEIPTPFAGVVMVHGAPEGTVLAVGQVLVTIQTSDEVPGTEHVVGEPAPIVGTISSQAVELSSRNTEVSRSTVETQVEALPIVRRLAKDLGVDLATVTGTGPEGRITRDDVQRAAQKPGAASSTAVDGHVDPQPRVVPLDQDMEQANSEPAPAGGRSVPMSKLRRTIAERVSAAWLEIPHVTAFESVDVTRLFASRKALRRRRNAPVSIDAMVVKAVVVALGRHAEITAHIEGDSLVYPSRIDVGVAVNTDDGLMVVVVEDPGRRDLVDLTAEILRLSEAARSRTLDAAAFTGQSFTVSNIGAVGGGYGTPIVPYGTTAILSVGRATDIPVARSGRLEIAPMMPLSLSYDHRVIDGAEGRRFLATVVENLEEPTLFLA